MPELRDTNFYADQVALRYPLLDKKSVRRICRYVMRKVGNLSLRGQDVQLKSSRYALTLKIFSLDTDVRRHNREHADDRMKMARMRMRRRRWNGTGKHSRKSKFPLKRIL